MAGGSESPPGKRNDGDPDERGAVADCSITETSGYATIDAQSCAIIQERAKFEPAIDTQGKPTRSSYSQRITWKLR